MKLKLHILFSFFALTLIFCPSAFAALEKSSKKECAMCHVMWLDVFRSDKETLIEWQPGNVLMKDTQGIVSSEEICYSCHDGYVADSRYIAWDGNNHAVYKKPSENIKVPDTLTLSSRDEIYCGTCHSPHSGRQTAPGASPSDTIPGPESFLRLANDDSRLCEACHVNEADFGGTNGHPLHTDKLKIPETLFDRGAVNAKNRDTVICQSCHKVHGAEGAKLTVMENSASALCTECHGERTVSGTKHDLRLTMPAETNIKGQTAGESGPCGACHVPHKSAGYRLLARKPASGNPASQICLSCHGESPGKEITGVGQYSHPIGMDALSEEGVTSARPPSDSLPLFSGSGKRQPSGTIQCFTCHNVHQWNPDSPSERGGKNAPGDASNSFLRISGSRSSALCVECHRDKGQVLSFDHNLTRTAPDAVNIQGAAAGISGPCGACHLPHNAAGPRLWARELSEDKALLSQYCRDCHDENGPAKEKQTGKNDHPVDVAAKGFDIALLDQIVIDLPLFNSDGGGETGDTIRCLTCHDPHIWDPLNPETADSPPQKNVEGDAHNSFLRKTNAPSPDLCGVCHPDNALVEGTDHDLSVTAADARNLLEETVGEAGVCSACHAVHNSPNDLKLWARSYGPITDENHEMDKLCTSCHSEGNIAEAKIPAIAVHPKGKLLENGYRYEEEGKEYQFLVEEEALVYTPIFDPTGKRVDVGNISCPSCHNAHQWSASLREKGVGVNVEGNSTNSFLRSLSYKNICAYCHGEDALFRYRLFHDPEKRSDSEEAGTNASPSP